MKQKFALLLVMLSGSLASAVSIASAACNSDLGGQLFDMAVTNDVQGVDRLLGQGACADGDWRMDRIPLCGAAYAENYAIAENLLKHGAKVNRNDASETPMICALKGAKPGFVKFLLDRGAIVTDDSKVVYHAARMNSPATVELLLAHGAAINSHDQYFVPLEAAVDKKLPDMVRFLISKGANPNAAIYQSHYSVSRPLLVAVSDENPSIDVVRALVEGGADIDYTPSDGFTAMHLAIEYSNDAAFDYLLSKGAKVPKKSMWLLNDSPRIARALLDAGEDPNTLIGSGRTILFKQKNAEVVELLIRAGADVNHRDEDGRTAFFKSFSDEAAAVRTMIRLGADLRIKDNFGLTPLVDWAQWGCNPAFNDCGFLDFALDNAKLIDANAANQKGVSVLMFVVSRSDAIDVNGKPTALTRIEKLVRLGANPKAADSSGKKVIDYAYDARVKELLKTLGAD